MDGEVLERVYKENLEERIIAYLSETRNISLEAAMNIYYCSKIADKIHQGVEGIQYSIIRFLSRSYAKRKKSCCQNQFNVSLDVEENIFYFAIIVIMRYIMDAMQIPC